MTEIKPCPECGRTPYIEKNIRHGIFCNNPECGSKFYSHGRTEEDAIDKWDREVLRRTLENYCGCFPRKKA